MAILVATKSIHAVLPVAAIVIGMPLIAGAVWYFVSVTRPYEVPAGQTVFDVAQGVWKWSNSDSTCRQVHHTISFSPDHKQMYYTSNKKIAAATGMNDSAFVYDIISYDRHSIRAFLRGETRKSTNGKLVIWDLVLKSPDMYAWHQADWPALETTAAIRRCTPEEL